VIAYEESEGYALVSGGAPKIEGEDGLCRTGTGVNEAGLWIFTRQQLRDDALVQKVRQIALGKGFDLSVLNDVQQAGCPALPGQLTAVPMPALQHSAACPPTGFDSIQSGFDLDAYVSKPWFIQQQAETAYLPKEQNFCVSAQYTRLEKKTLLGYDIKVHNVAYERDGEKHDSGDTLYAKIVDAKTGKLEVAPYFLPPALSGAYWVLAYEESEGFALVSGGAPTHDGEDGLCRTGTGVNGSGLWIATRQQRRDEGLVQKVRAMALAKGLDLTVLNDVDQTTCPPLSHSLQSGAVYL